MNARIISFINYKGGVGKTTLAVETAVTLAKTYDFKVLLVDLDPQTNGPSISLMKRNGNNGSRIMAL